MCYDAISFLEPYQQMITDLRDAVLEIHHDNNRRISTVLVLGCGTGSLEQELIKSGSEFEITSVDISTSMLKRAQLKVPSKKCKWFQADLRHWDIPAFYNIVVLSNVAYTISDSEMKVLVARVRKARKGRQVLLISDPFPTTSFIDYFKQHLIWKGKEYQIRRLWSILSRPGLTISLIFVAFANIIIDWRGGHVDYIFRTVGQWKQILGETMIMSNTYGGLNYLITSVTK